MCVPVRAPTCNVCPCGRRPGGKLPILPDIAPEEVGAKHQSTVRRQTVRVDRRSLARLWGVIIHPLTERSQTLHKYGPANGKRAMGAYGLRQGKETTSKHDCGLCLTLSPESVPQEGVHQSAHRGLDGDEAFNYDLQCLLRLVLHTRTRRQFAHHSAYDDLTGEVALQAHGQPVRCKVPRDPADSAVKISRRKLDACRLHVGTELVPEILNLRPGLLEIGVGESYRVSVGFTQPSLGLLEPVALADQRQYASELAHACKGAAKEVDHTVFWQLTYFLVVFVL